MRLIHAGLGGGIVAVAAVVALSGASTASTPVQHWGTGFAASASAVPGDEGAAAIAPSADSFDLYDKGTSDVAFVDVGPDGFSPGDYIVFRDELLSPDQSQDLGDLNVQCTFFFDHAQCDGTASLTGRGKLTFAGTSPMGNNPFLLAITGGTREFRTARGQIRVAPIAHTDDANVTVQIANR